MVWATQLCAFCFVLSVRDNLTNELNPSKYEMSSISRHLLAADCHVLKAKISRNAYLKMFCCLRNCLNGDLRTPVASNKTREPDIQLDAAHMGHEVVIVKNGRRLCGSGGALATAPLVQSKSYFEVKIQQSGQWSVGLATRQADLNKTKGGMDKDSWCMCSDNIVRNNENELITVGGIGGADEVHQTNGGDNLPTSEELSTYFPTEGDTIGVAYDHVELNFFLNGKNLEVPVLNVKGTVYPVLYVDDGAILDIILSNFCYGPPAGFEKIMLEQSLL